MLVGAGDGLGVGPTAVVGVPELHAASPINRVHASSLLVTVPCPQVDCPAARWTSANLFRSSGRRDDAASRRAAAVQRYRAMAGTASGLWRGASAETVAVSRAITVSRCAVNVPSRSAGIGSPGACRAWTATGFTNTPLRLSR